MSCYDLCPPKTSVAVPQPIAESCNELCARQCPDSSAFIQPPPVVVTFPGPILSSFPQQAVVGSSGAPAFGGSLGSLGFGGSSGFGGSRGYGNSFGLGGCGGYGGSLGYGRSLGYGGNVGYGGSLGYGSSGFGNCRRSYSSGFSSYGTGYYLPGAQRWGRSRRGSCGSF
ncbi:uncharacterized protein LOC141734585 isoform X1 [Larus michahellis]|uniref:uncharacterized protein LOC141734585 isoform X1 n=1 Tax=Larus michahellis TaxID=119627 RepID=UPI003D9B122A